jgi:chromosome segregation ATPase
MLRVEKDEFEYKYTEAVGSSQEHAETFDSLRGAVAASAGTRALLERKLDEEREQREKVETKLNKLKAEHEARTAELVAATQRLRDAEEMAEQHANEARVHRDAVLAGLDKISTKDVTKSDNGDKERVLALQGQVTAANALVKKYQQEADTAADRLRGAEERIAGLEAYQEQASREGVSIRRQLQGTLRDTQSLQAANSDLKQQLAKQQLETNATLVQYNALKDILGERGISPTSAVRSRNSFRGSPREGSPEQMRLRELEVQLTASQNALEEARAQAAVQAQDSETTYRDKLAQLENDYQSAVHYVKGTEKMLKQLKEQLSRYKTENSRLKEQLVELEDKLDAAESSASKSSPRPPADWETHEKNLQAEISRLQTDLRDKTANLEDHLQSIQHELVDAETERDAAMHSTEEAIRRLESSRRDLEQLQTENALLERRALDAEHKVGNLLDQVELSVDNYRRRSRQGDVPGATSVTPTAISTITNGGGSHGAHPAMGMAMGGGPGHTRQESIISDVDSLYDSNPRGAPSTAPGGGGGGGGGERNSAALDSLANELETLRSHWEATNKNYRLSNTFDFEANPGVIAKKDEQVSLGLSESLADWRKRLDDSHPAGEGEGRGAESQSPGSGRAR